MSAKSELKDLLDDLSEEQAREMLARLRPNMDRPPSLTQLVKMTRAEQAAVLQKFPLEIDLEEFLEWDAFDDFTDE